MVNLQIKKRRVNALKKRKERDVKYMMFIFVYPLVDDKSSRINC